MAEKDTRKRWWQTTPTWKVVAIASLLFAGTLILSIWGPYWLWPERNETTIGEREQSLAPGTGLYDPARPVDHVTYRQARFAVHDQSPPLALPENQMVEVDMTEEGYLLYSRFQGGGGGEGPDAVPQAEGPIFLKTVDGRFVPLTQE